MLADAETTDRLPFAHQRYHDDALHVKGLHVPARHFRQVWLVRHIGKVNDRLIQDGARGLAIRNQRSRIRTFRFRDGFRGKIILRRFVDEFPVGAIEITERPTQQFRRIFCDHIQHGLNVRWRAGDDLQNFTGRRLLFERFADL